MAMMIRMRFFYTAIALLLVISGFGNLPIHDRISFIDEAAADYIGFTSDKRVNDDSTNEEQASAAMAVYSNDIYLVWHDTRSSDFDIYFTKSTDGGSTWGDGTDNDNDVRVDDTDRNINNTDNETDQKYPDIAVDSSGTIYVVWQDNREGREDSDIYFAKSTDGGANFGTNVRVDHNGTGLYDQQYPCIAVDGDSNIYVAWEDERNEKNDRDIYFTKSTDGGSSFNSPDVLVDDDTGTGLQKYPKMALEENGGSPHIYLVWQDERAGGGNYDIYFSKSTDGGATWGDGLDNDNDDIGTDYTIGAQEHPSITLDGNGNIVVIWDDEREGNYKTLYMCNSSDGGDSWGVNTNITDAYTDNSDQAFPVISTFGNYMCVAWVDNRNDEVKSDIYFAISENNGATFGPFLKVDQGPDDTIQSQPRIIMISAVTAYIVWEDNRDDTRGNDIYFAKSGWIILKAPELSKSNFSPATGAESTQFHFTVTYTDEENDPPAVDYPKLYLFKDAEGKEAFPDSPFLMYSQEEPWQDDFYSNGMIFEKRITLFEELNYSYYIETAALYGNTTEVRTNLTEGPILDLSNVTFSDPYPAVDEWLDNAWVNCSISIKDVGFAGVHPLYVKYRVSLNGTDQFSDWTNAYMNWYTIPNGLKVYVSKLFGEGDNNYIQWSASDNFENGPNESAMYRIKVDSSKVTFSDPIPDPSESIWYNTETVEVGITVNDFDGIGVNASTIEYAYTTTGHTGYGEWQNAGKTSNGKIIVVKADITFANGTKNYVKWRATDLLENGPSESDPYMESESYKVRIDTSLSEVYENHPPTAPSNVLPTTTIDTTPTVTWDASIDEDDDTITYWIQIGSTENGSETLTWKNVGTDRFYDITKRLNYKPYYIQLKSFDGYDFSTIAYSQMIISTEGNTPPEPPEELSPQYISDRKPKITWSEAYDADGDTPLTYYIQIGRKSGGEEILKR
jgi:hypothetical protein